MNPTTSAAAKPTPLRYHQRCLIRPSRKLWTPLNVKPRTSVRLRQATWPRLGCDLGLDQVIAKSARQDVVMTPDESSSLLIREAAPENRDALVDLLAADGWSRSRLAEWATTGIVLELYDPAYLVPRGGAIVRSAGDATFELLAWASDLDVDSVEVAQRLVGAIGDILRRNGGERVYVSVLDATPLRLAPLLAVGFRPASSERGGSVANLEVHADSSRELVWLDQEL